MSIVQAVIPIADMVQSSWRSSKAGKVERRAQNRGILLLLLSFPENAALFDISIKKENEFWYPPCIMIRQVEGQQHCRTSVASVFIRLWGGCSARDFGILGAWWSSSPSCHFTWASRLIKSVKWEDSPNTGDARSCHSHVRYAHS